MTENAKAFLDLAVIAVCFFNMVFSYLNSFDLGTSKERISLAASKAEKSLSFNENLLPWIKSVNDELERLIKRCRDLENEVSELRRSNKNNA